MAEGPERQVSDACGAQGGSEGSAGAGSRSERGISGAARAGGWWAVLEGVGLAFRQSRKHTRLPRQRLASHSHPHFRISLPRRYRIRSGPDL